ncbi:ribonuclease H1-like [Babylonia areolata]|uniref:ribonuclease H1-like n=1 Tax=Babylonia areolata TaxID=304850 RepID=UPI003FCFA7D1
MPFYYAVRSGRVPGVYKDWPTCQAQVKSYPNARFKKFATEAEAKIFVRGVEADDNVYVFSDESSSDSPDYRFPSDSPSMNDSSDEEQDLHTAPSSSARQAKGHSNQSAAEETLTMLRATAKVLRSSAEQLLKGVDSLSPQIDQLAASLHTEAQGSAAPTFSSGGGAQSKNGGARDRLKRSYSDFTPLGSSGGARGGTTGGNDTANKYKKMKLDPSGCTDCGFTGIPFPDHEGKVVYTDGASFDNGYATARAGIGVYWGPRDPYNKSERLTGRQTNNRAEIHAAEVAVQQAKQRGVQNLILHTDSQFLISGITTWIKKWKKNGWKLSTGGDVINREDFENLDKAISGINVKWMHVRGHRGIEGNEAADRLANAGAKKPL